MAEVAQQVDRATVWVVDLDGPGSAGEQTHQALRAILGEVCEADPNGLVIEHQTSRPPRLRLPSAELGISISHTVGRALVAVAQQGPIGVDIESSERQVDAVRLAKRYFHEGERQWLAAVPEADRNSSFLRLWTAKEAYLKALGTGLAKPLDSFEVVLDADGGPRLADGDGWTFHRLDLGEDWVATVVTERSSGPPQLHEYQP